MSLIDARDLTVRLGGTLILDRVSLSVEPGEIITIVGPNGSGKSTLLRALIGAVPLASGSVTRAPGLRIGYVPQRLHVDPSLPLTVRRFLSLPRPEADAAIADALSRAGVEGLAGRQVGALSGGQLQRVLLARALLGRPQLLMLDEPTQGLDQPASAAFYRAIEAARADLGCAVVMVSHDLHVVMSASDRVICLNTHICCEGHPEVVASAPAYRALFGDGTMGTLALYRHHHHGHSHDDDGGPVPAQGCDHDHS
ncbi:metal ABC transporter ATP-binding protein [Paracoccus suum]|uniref:Metal ABC transporter ATP-binding protein n=1 Tax=Paracoccus suum TaxID=2259340 RepID=A0A344PP61_9RHOB|nr:metal ABC transporter ATP-binding protein [Paracoccus suum]AXC51166.1 metal ABC transporter ATP-binding protein [Paracoccus suum]